MRAYIDVSIFSTPNKALGNATGVIELPLAPEVGQPVPWPPGTHPIPTTVQAVLSSDVVTNIDHKVTIRGVDLSVSTDGLVHEREEDARQTAQYLESAYGLVFCEY